MCQWDKAWTGILHRKAPPSMAGRVWRTWHLGKRLQHHGFALVREGVIGQLKQVGPRFQSQIHHQMVSIYVCKRALLCRWLKDWAEHSLRHERCSPRAAVQLGIWQLVVGAGRGLKGRAGLGFIRAWFRAQWHQWVLSHWIEGSGLDSARVRNFGNHFTASLCFQGSVLTGIRLELTDPEGRWQSRAGQQTIEPSFPWPVINHAGVRETVPAGTAFWLDSWES